MSTTTATPRTAMFSTDEIYREQNTARSLTSDLVTIESNLEALDEEKANSGHTHAQSEISGLPAKLESIDTAIANLQSGSSSGGSTVSPLLIASMHYGKLDNNNGSELSSSTRICSDPFPVQNGKSYWQVNTKGVNMYALLYDADEVFVAYLGSKASGAEIVVNNPNAAYMRLSSLIGEYDLTNEFRIYDVDPASSSGSGEGSIDAYTKAESDARYAMVNHTHDDLHSHANKTVLDGITAEKVAAWDAGTSGSGTAPTVDAYTKNEADTRFAAASHVHSDYMSAQDAASTFANVNHTHTEYAPTAHSHSDYMTTIAAGNTFANKNHTHTEYAAASHNHSGYASTYHTHSDYYSTSGGIINGDVNINGILRVNGQQSIFDSGSMITLSTNNRETMIAGSKVYSKTAISVSSDERLKENIKAIDAEKWVDFIKGLDVKTFNYIGDDTPCIGVIAQDVQKTEMGEFFISVQDGKEGYLAVKAADLVFPLIATVQRLSEEVDALKQAM